MELLRSLADQRSFEPVIRSKFTSVSLICTVRNEAKTIGPLIESMLQQTLSPDEIVIADAASSDGTPAIVESYIARGYPIKLVDGRGNISAGRNKAIAQACCDIIVSADAGLTLGNNWLEVLVKPIEAGAYDVTGGASQPVPQSLFEAISSEILYVKSSSIQEKAEAGTWRWPTRNGLAFRRSDWEKVGGFPEYLDHNEDTIFAAKLQALGKRFLFVPEAMVYFHPRDSFQALYRQTYLYARGDGVAGTKNRVYYVRLIAALVNFTLLMLSPRLLRKPQLRLLLFGGFVSWLAYQRYRLRLAFVERPVQEQLKGLLLIPPLRLMIEYARLFGGTAGRIKRLRW